MADNSIQALIGTAFSRLPLQAGSHEPLGREIRTIAMFADKNPRAGRVPARFRDLNRSSTTRELHQLGHQAERVIELTENSGDARRLAGTIRRLADTVDGLHQTSINALANVGFLGAERLALQKFTRRFANSKGKLTDQELEVLQKAAWSAAHADVSKIPKVVPRGRPPNERVKVLVRVLYHDFQALTGRRPTLTVKSDIPGSPGRGPFFDLVNDIFAALNIEADAEAAIRSDFQDRKAAKTKMPKK